MIMKKEKAVQLSEINTVEIIGKFHYIDEMTEFVLKENFLYYKMNSDRFLLFNIFEIRHTS